MIALGDRGAPADAAERREIDRAAGRMTVVLRVGLATAIALMGAATAFLLAGGPGASSARVTSAATLRGYLGGDGLLAGLAAGSPEAYLTLGVYALVATPVLRVVTGLYYFRRAGNFALAKLTGVVLVLLLMSLFLLGPVLK